MYVAGDKPGHGREKNSQAAASAIRTIGARIPGATVIPALCGIPRRISSL